MCCGLLGFLAKGKARTFLVYFLTFLHSLIYNLFYTWHPVILKKLLLVLLMTKKL